jgi:F0F1-type ATP synthase assembly protein I
MTAKPRNLASYGDYLGLGIQIAASMVLPLLGGAWLDNRFNTSPWFTLGGALFGIFSIFGIVLKIAFTANHKSPAHRKGKDEKKQ